MYTYIPIDLRQFIVSLYLSLSHTQFNLNTNTHSNNRRGEIVTKAGDIISKAKTNLPDLDRLKEEYLSEPKIKLNMTYLQSNLLVMGMPKKRPQKIGQNPLSHVASYLEQKHNGKYMIWNLSESSYDTSAFKDQVIEYSFPGYPAPPLHLLFQLCMSIDSWLNADKDNVAVVHCATGRGRTAVVACSYLAWKGQFDSVDKALKLFCGKRNTNPRAVLIPSQRRYLTYFTSVLEGRRPSSRPKILRRIVIHTIPKMERNDDKDYVVCRPFVQIFKDGKMLYSSRDDKNNELKGYRIKDETIKFEPNVPLHGDVLLRCRHLTDKSNEEKMVATSVFRIAFNTGYVQRDSLVLERDELDGTGSSKKFQDSFRVEMYFQESDASVPSSMKDDVAIKPFWDHIDRRKRLLQRKLAKKRKEKEAAKPRQQVQGNGKISTPKMVRTKDAFSLGELPDEDDEEIEFDPKTDETTIKKPSGEMATKVEKSSNKSVEKSSPARSSNELKRLEKLEKELGLSEQEKTKVESPKVVSSPSSPFDVDAELKELEISASALDDDIDGLLGDIDLGDDDDTTTLEEDDTDLGDLEDYLKTFDTTNT